MKVIQWKTPATFFPWPYVQQHIDCIDSTVYHAAIEVAQEQFLVKTESCPQCGTPASKLFWFREGHQLVWTPAVFEDKVIINNRAFSVCASGFDKGSGRFFIRGEVNVPADYKMEDVALSGLVKTPNTKDIAFDVPVTLGTDLMNDW